MKRFTLILSACIASLSGNAYAQSFVEEFEDASVLTGAGWDIINRSNPVGNLSWFQGSSTFPVYSQVGHIAANFNSTGSTGTISTWLIAPVRTLNNGDQIIFYTVTKGSYADRMQICLSQNGASSNVGTTETSVGDFSTLIYDINPTYAVSQYPASWTKFTFTLSGLPGGGVSGRFAFRYFVENGGASGANSNYIGIDSLAYVSIVNGMHEQNISSQITVSPNPAADNITLSFGSASAGERTISITDIVGRKVYEGVFTANTFSIDVAELNAGTYFLTSKGEDGVGTKRLVIE